MAFGISKNVDIIYDLVYHILSQKSIYALVYPYIKSWFWYKTIYNNKIKALSYIMSKSTFMVLTNLASFIYAQKIMASSYIISKKYIYGIYLPGIIHM